MEQYEYKTLAYDTKGFWGGTLDTEQFERELNCLGSEGWEMVSSLSTTQTYGSSKSVVCVFKRKKQ